MLFHSLSVVPLLLGAVAAFPHLRPFSTFTNVTIFSPPADYNDPRVLYARTVELEGGVLLATWENYSPEPPLVYFPIFESCDGGETWREISKIQDQVNGWGLRYQPFLYELPARVGRYPAGTVLAAGNSIPENLNQTRIDVYASHDRGYTWEFVSQVAAGGAAIPDNGIPAIWEPFLLYYAGEMITYFSDQRDPRYGQKLVHQTSKDLLTWSAPVDDVVSGRYTDRPGMTTVTQLPNGKYMMTFEFGGGPLLSGSTVYEFPVYFKINDSPLLFNASTPYPVYTAGGVQPDGSPYITWTPVGGENGTILVSSGGATAVYYNQALGAGPWSSFEPANMTVSYSRHLRVLSNWNHLLIAGAGILPPAPDNKVRVGVYDIAASL